MDPRISYDTSGGIAAVTRHDPASLERSRTRIANAIERLCGPAYTASDIGITRHAYVPEYRRTLEQFETAFAALGYAVHHDPVGTLVASNRPPGAPCWGVGSHCDANRNGGPYDGTLGVVCALEICRLAAERDLDLPLRAFAFLEEEGSGFDTPLLGSRIMLGDVDDAELAELRDDAGTPFPDAARAAGFAPDRHAESARELDGLQGWIELHIEQARALEDADLPLGIVEAIAGLVHAEVTVVGRADHAGGTPMALRRDPLVVAAEAVAALDGLTRRLSDDAVGTVGALEVAPGLINVVPAEVTFTVDVRSASGDHLTVLDALLTDLRDRAAARGLDVRYRERTRLDPVTLDAGVCDALRAAADAAGAGWMDMVSGAAHDTMLVASRVPSAMVFVPCRDGVSHAPDELADPADAALAAHVMLDALIRLQDAAPTPTEGPA